MATPTDELAATRRQLRRLVVASMTACDPTSAAWYCDKLVSLPRSSIADVFHLARVLHAGGEHVRALHVLDSRKLLDVATFRNPSRPARTRAAGASLVVLPQAARDVMLDADAPSPASAGGVVSPDGAPFFLLGASCHRALKQWDRAVGVLEAAMEGPSQPTLWVPLTGQVGGELLVLHGRGGSAEELRDDVPLATLLTAAAAATAATPAATPSGSAVPISQRRDRLHTWHVLRVMAWRQQEHARTVGAEGAAFAAPSDVREPLSTPLSDGSYVNTIAAMCAVRGEALLQLDNRARAAQWLLAAVRLDPYSVSSAAALQDHHLLNDAQEEALQALLQSALGAPITMVRRGVAPPSAASAVSSGGGGDSAVAPAAATGATAAAPGAPPVTKQRRVGGVGPTQPSSSFIASVRSSATAAAAASATPSLLENVGGSASGVGLKRPLITRPESAPESTPASSTPLFTTVAESTPPVALPRTRTRAAAMAALLPPQPVHPAAAVVATPTGATAAGAHLAFGTGGGGRSGLHPPPSLRRAESAAVISTGAPLVSLSSAVAPPFSALGRGAAALASPISSIITAAAPVASSGGPSRATATSSSSAVGGGGGGGGSPLSRARSFRGAAAGDATVGGGSRVGGGGGRVTAFGASITPRKGAATAAGRSITTPLATAAAAAASATTTLTPSLSSAALSSPAGPAMDVEAGGGGAHPHIPSSSNSGSPARNHPPSLPPTFPLDCGWLYCLYASRLRRYAPASVPLASKFAALETSLGLASNGDVLFNKAEALYYQHDPSAALSVLQRLVGGDPHHRRGATLHYTLLVALKRPAELFKLAHAAVEAAPKDALSWYAVGCYYLSAGKPGEGEWMEWAGGVGGGRGKEWLEECKRCV